MLKQRIITGVILAPVAVAGVVFLQGAWFALFIGLIVTLGAWEWARLAGEAGQKGRVIYAAAIAILMIGLYRDSWALPYVMVPAVTWWLYAAGLVVRYPASKPLLQGQLICQLYGLLVLLPAWYGLVWLHAQPSGLWLILVLVITVWAADIGAYFAGKGFGKRKLMPAVSPGKTLEGLLGGVVLTQLLTLALLLTLGWQFQAIIMALLGTLLVVLFSVLGDLNESLFKREQGIKDSSNLLPGHGGILDRIDSLTAAIPVFALGWWLIGSLLA